MASPSSREIAEVKEDAGKYQVLVRTGRDARFRVEVISGYYFTCALTGYRLESSSGFNLLQAAHIQAHSKKGPDTADNGLALTPTAHALFDALLWTITDDLRIQVAQSQISESILPGGSHFRLADLHGKRLQFAPAATLRPNPTHLAWHRSQFVIGRS
jgi:putative restriction endonuclease